MALPPTRVWTMRLIHVNRASDLNQLRFEAGKAVSYFEKRRLWEEDLRWLVVCICARYSEASNLIVGTDESMPCCVQGSCQGRTTPRRSLVLCFGGYRRNELHMKLVITAC
jgi:hypothetical protein